MVNAVVSINEVTVHYYCTPYSGRDVHGMGFPMGMGIPWEAHGNGPNGNKIRNWEWEWETTSMGMGITCTPIGIYCHRFALYSL